MGTITAANSSFTLSIASVYPTGQTLEGYATDDAFAAEAQDTAETMMGVDGKLSAGFVFNPTPMVITLQADSSSIQIFEDWDMAEKAAKEKLFAQANVRITSLGRKYTLRNGVLQNLTRMPTAKKVMQPRAFRIVWESVSPAAA